MDGPCVDTSDDDDDDEEDDNDDDDDLDDENNEDENDDAGAREEVFIFNLPLNFNFLNSITNVIFNFYFLRSH